MTSGVGLSGNDSKSITSSNIAFGYLGKRVAGRVEGRCLFLLAVLSGAGIVLETSMSSAAVRSTIDA